jgi:hypothetical protein
VQTTLEEEVSSLPLGRRREVTLRNLGQLADPPNGIKSMENGERLKYRVQTKKDPSDLNLVLECGVDLTVLDSAGPATNT